MLGCWPPAGNIYDSERILGIRAAIKYLPGPKFSKPSFHYSIVPNGAIAPEFILLNPYAASVPSESIRIYIIKTW